jgi:uncharacterized membrane protein
MSSARRADAASESALEARRARFEVLVGRILRGGVALSVVLLSSGLVWHWLSTGIVSFDYRIEKMTFFEFLFADARDVAKGAMRPRLLISLGIATLLLTPYLRVVASFVYFGAVERDLKYTLFTGLVFGVLTYSLLLR